MHLVHLLIVLNYLYCIDSLECERIYCKHMLALESLFQLFDVFSKL